MNSRGVLHFAKYMQSPGAEAYTLEILPRENLSFTTLILVQQSGILDITTEISSIEDDGLAWLIDFDRPSGYVKALTTSAGG